MAAEERQEAMGSGEEEEEEEDGDSRWDVLILTSTVAGNRAVAKTSDLLMTLFKAKGVAVAELIDAAFVRWFRHCI